MMIPAPLASTMAAASLLLLLLATTATPSHAFGVPSWSSSISRSRTRLCFGTCTTTTSSTALNADNADSSESTLNDANTEPPQSQNGNELARPDTYVRCGNCQTHFAVLPEDFGQGKGRRLQCSICNHTWFQSKDRIMSLQAGYELIARPDYELDRISLNLQENKQASFLGDSKLYVGNIAFGCVEDDLYQLFSTALGGGEKGGGVGEVSLVRDDTGRNRGFGFVTVRTEEQADAAIAQLDGKPLKGRNIAVRKSNT